METGKIIVRNVIKGSIAEEAGIEKGDIILEINGNTIENTIEYKFLTSDEHLEVLVEKKSGEKWEVEIDKDFYDDMGIEFDDSSLDMPKRCSNKCIFCFIDQLPGGMRESLYFKDDDSMLSFLQGNFITFTNMKDSDIDRIIKYRISPINVSVHTTNPDLRIKMLNNKRAGSIMDILKRLSDADIKVNCQIVLCPGINDGDELKRTLNDLFSLYPSISNVAAVPIGLTKHREGLFELKGYNEKTSKELIELVEPIQKSFNDEVGEVFVRLADEFYIMANMELPDIEHYADFEQLEDGIGMLKYVEMCINDDLENTTTDCSGKSCGFITGISAYDFIDNMAKKIENKLNVKIKTYPVKNDFFGPNITVSGLITGNDIINQLKGKIEENTLFIPSNMLKSGEEIFLDDISLSELSNELGTKIVQCRFSGEDTIEKIINEVI